MAALAAKAIKDQRKKAASRTVDQALNNINEQRLALNYVAQKHRENSLSSVSTLDSFRTQVNPKLRNTLNSLYFQFKKGYALKFAFA